MSVLMFPINHDGSGSSGMKKYSRERHLVCPIGNTADDDDWCDPFTVLHLGYLHYAKLRLEINFFVLEDDVCPVEDVKFEVL